MKRLKCLLIAVLMLVTSVTVPGISAGVLADYAKYGDADGNGVVESADALLVLQHAVGKITLPQNAQSWCDVDDNNLLNSSDALQVLQYAVGKINRFSGDHTPYSQEEYQEMIKSLSYDTPATEITDAYEIAEDGGMIYNPLSREAKKNGTLNKYKNAAVTTGTLKTANGTSVVYSMPTDVTAYDMVPVTYTITDNKDYAPVHFEATAAEEAERNNGQPNYDCILPNRVSLDFDFLGYVNGTKDTSNRALNSLDFSNDKQGTQYPQYNTSELIHSGTVQRSQYTWYRFKYTNTGDTILDSDGNGTFCFEPVLEKKNADGQYTTYLIPANIYYRITDTLYPGESGTIDFIFTWDRDGNGTSNPPSYGDYRIKILSEIRNETSNPENYFSVIWGGYTYCTSYYNFSIAKDAADTPVQAVKNNVKGAPTRNNWLHSYEEFMTSYDSYLQPSKIDTSEIHTMYLQCAPWTKSVVLKLMNGSSDNIAAATVPVNVESNSLSIKLNTSAQNYIIKDDGTRYPAMATQSMADMRVNTSLGPDADTKLLNELLDMKECGVNIVTTTSAFETDMGGRSTINDTTDANWFMCDAVRLLDMKLEGYVTYPYYTAGNVNKARLITKDSVTFPVNYTPDSVADALLAKACGVKSVYQFLRWGDNYYVSGKGTIPITAEDSRGWMRIDISNREKVGTAGKTDFRKWLKEKYGTIGELNHEWGKSYTSFDAIDPENGTADDHGNPNYTAATADFAEWSVATNNLDVFRTEQRVQNYKDLLAETAGTFNAVMSFRTEGANWTSVVPYDTGNQHYRHVYYSQRRGAMIPEILGASGVVKIHSDYTTLPYTPSEITELTKSSVSLGITPMHLAQLDRLREIAINSRYGQDYSKEYNLSGSATKGVFISTTRSLYQWYKATYEAGGIPGVLWEDWLCDGFVTETQMKEMKFYSQKIAEAVATDEGQKWSKAEKTDAAAAVENSKGVFTYAPEYVQSLIDKTAADRKADK